mgnify:FL=1
MNTAKKCGTDGLMYCSKKLIAKKIKRILRPMMLIDLSAKMISLILGHVISSLDLYA